MNQKGIALVIVLWIAVLLSGIVIAVSYVTRLELRQAYYPAREMQLIAASVAAVEKVKAGLGSDDKPYDSLKSTWATEFRDDTQQDDINVHVDIRDEESRCNITTLSYESLGKAPVFDSAANKSELIDSLADWQDADSAALPAGGEDSFYKFLSPPARCKNAPLDCVEEVARVKGFTDIQVIDKLKQFSTVSTDGRININTAPLETLMALPGVDYLLAQAIIARRNGKDLTQGTEDDLPYETPTRIQEVVGAEVYKGIKNLITVRSSYFRVIVTTKLSKYSKIVEALLFRQGGTVKVKCWKES